jgi:cysteine desulfurase family protein
MAARASQLVDQTRARLAAFFGAPDPSHVLFTASCTEAINLALKGFLQEGDRVLATQLEHNATARPLTQLQTSRQLDVQWLAVDEQGFVCLDGLRQALQSADTRLVCITHASNVMGAIQPLKEISHIVRDAGAYLLVDAAQTAGVVPLSMVEIPIDFLAWPGHKGLYGHMGIGGLCVSQRITSLTPLREGGTGTDSLSLDTPTQWPERFEAGTLNLLGIASLHGGLTALDQQPIDTILSHHQTLRQTLCEICEELELPYIGRGNHHRYVGTLSFQFPGLDAHTLSGLLDASFGIATRAGLHCAPLAHKSLQTAPEGTVRASVGKSTTINEIEALQHALREIKTQFG